MSISPQKPNIGTVGLAVGLGQSPQKQVSTQQSMQLNLGELRNTVSTNQNMLPNQQVGVEERFWFGL